MAKAPAPKVKMPAVPKAKGLPKLPTLKNTSVGNGLKGYISSSKMVTPKTNPYKFSG